MSVACRDLIGYSQTACLADYCGYFMDLGLLFQPAIYLEALAHLPLKLLRQEVIALHSFEEYSFLTFTSPVFLH